MSNKNQSHFEWEFLSEPQNIYNITKTNIKPYPEKIEIYRDDNFDIRLKLTGVMSSKKMEFPAVTLAGMLTEGEKVSGALTHPGLDRNVTLEGVHQDKFTRMDDGSFINTGLAFKVIFERIMKTNEKKGPCRIIDYCVAGPDIPLAEAVLMSAERKEIETINWNVEGSMSSNFWEFKTEDKFESYGRNSLFFKTSLGEILICKTNKNYAKENLRPISIHYLGNEKFIDDSYRKIVLHALSFVFGKRMIPIGTSCFDNKGRLTKSVSIDIFSLNINKEINDHAHPSWFYESRVSQSYNQESANHIFDLIMLAIDKYNLEDVMIDYWIARSLPLGSNLILYASALEGLVNKWLKHNPTNNVYVDKNDFKDIINPILKSIESNFPGEISWEKVVSLIQNANNLGGRDKHYRFFEANNLKYGKLENDVLKSRNKFAHGGKYLESDPRELIHIANAYMTLFHRALLSVIGYKGKYIDYSCIGFPVRDINEALGGSINSHVSI